MGLSHVTLLSSSPPPRPFILPCLSRPQRIESLGLGVAALLYLVIGSKPAAQAAKAIAAENAEANSRLPELQLKYREAMAKTLSRVAILQKGVSAITGNSESAHRLLSDVSRSRRARPYDEEGTAR